ncbi:endolytic transglycosylase MltG [Pseudactinotalea sp. Z1748]|uniref:endolytic transglycosylase MltG n=1 Tax=Pseudactinotalea sp. Z1748 TaxID=3413027 RepID=UPI003C7C1F73
MTDLFDEQFGTEETPAAATSTGQRRASRERAAKRRAQRRRNAITFVVMVASIALLLGGAFVLIRPLFQGSPEEPEVTDFPGPGSGEVEVVVNTGDTGTDIGRTLVEANVVATVGAFTEAYNNNPQAVQIQAGTYTLREEMAAVDAVQALLDPGSRADLTVTIPEGWRATQIYERVAARLEVPLEDVEAAAEEFAASELPDAAEGEIEGWLFASTYTVETDTEPAELLQQMVDLTVRQLEEREVPEDEWQDTLIIASILELEVNNPEHWGQVARVVENRLAGCSGDGTLGMDTTYAYGLNKPAWEITRSEWQEDHPYNTRRVAGLPPTPIGAPGEPAIEAVLNPPEGEWCYFVTVNPNTGETRFTDDIDEHRQNQELYREWLAQQDGDEDEDGED